MTIDLLCKVVDNFGDIGVVYRLARALSDADRPGDRGPDSASAAAGLALRLVVDDLAAFRALLPAVDADKAFQTVNGWTVVRWDAEEAAALFRSDPPRTVIECFACGRPDWYEDILFDEADGADRLIVDLEYLTAETWASDFHRLPSRTRSGRVKKALFMPGFARGTGGLILDRRFVAAREAFLDEARRPALRTALLDAIAAQGGRSSGAGAAGPSSAASGPLASAGQAIAGGETETPRTAAARAATAEAFWVTVFTYERDFAATVRELAAAAENRPIVVLVAAGRCAVPFLDAWEAAGRPVPAIELPFLDQATWDEVLLASDLLIVRGEDSLARAALSGRPFLWHAYPLPDGGQLAKVRALLERLAPFFESEDFALLERQWLLLNAEGPGEEAGRGLADLLARAAPGGRMDASFHAWSEALIKNGDLAAALLTFIGELR